MLLGFLLCVFFFLVRKVDGEDFRLNSCCEMILNLINSYLIC